MSTVSPKTIDQELADQWAKADEYREIVSPFMYGFADAKGSGTRYGPVHLFIDGKEWNAMALCGRRAKLWNFEGETDFDFCPRCIAAARKLRTSAPSSAGMDSPKPAD